MKQFYRTKFHLRQSLTGLALVLLGLGHGFAAVNSCTPSGTDPATGYAFTKCLIITNSGADQTVTNSQIPIGSVVTAKVWGAGGGNGVIFPANYGSSYGGAGAYATGQFTVSAPLQLVVGSPGAYGSSMPAVYGGGGAGGGGAYSVSGGGLSGIFYNSTPYANASTTVPLIVAGGGGGGSGSNWSAMPGSGGGLTGQDVQIMPLTSSTNCTVGPPSVVGATGGTQTAGGLPGTESPVLASGATSMGSAGTQWYGGAGGNGTSYEPYGGANSGGGGGYFGGGGGSGSRFCDDMPGAGGSGYLSSSVSGGSFLTSPRGATNTATVLPAPNSTDPQYVAGVAKAQGPGLIVLQWSPPPSYLTVTKTASAGAFKVGGTGQYYEIKINVVDGPTQFPISLTDVLPTGITTNGAITATGGTISGCPASGTTTLAGCTIATGAATGDIIIKVPVAVGTTAINPSTNTATVTGGGDPRCPTGTTCFSSVTTPLIDAFNESVSKQPSIATTTDVSTNDKFAPNSVYTTTGGTCAGITMSTAGVASYTSPAPLTSCTVLYKVCAPAPDSTVCDTATLTVTSTAAPVTTVTKTASQTPLIVDKAGQFYTITIAVTNGPTTAPITLTDLLPTGITTSGAITSTGGVIGGCGPAGSTSLAGCAIATGAPTGSTVITVPVNVSDTAVNPSVNTVTISGGGSLLCPTGASCKSTVSTPILNAVSETVTKSPAISTTTTVNSNDTYPTSSVFTKTGGTCASATITTAGVVTYTTPGPLLSCTVDYKICAPSPNATVCDTATLTVNTTAGPAYTVTKTASSDPLYKAVGGQYYTISINITSGPTTSAISIADVLPTGITLSAAPSIVSGTATLSGCPATGSTLSGCSIASGTAAGVIEIRVPVSVGATAVSPSTNTVTLTGGGDTRCPGGANCTSSVSTAVAASVAPVSVCPVPSSTCTPDAGYTNCVRVATSGSPQPFVVPAGVSTIDARIWGAGGGGMTTSYWGSYGGAGGGFSSGILNVTPGSTLNLTVGGKGLRGSSVATYGGGAPGGTGAMKGASGGGLTGIWVGTPFTVGNQLLIAGGGGGSSEGMTVAVNYAGAGGGLTGGSDGSPAISGSGGTQTAGGLGATNSAECSSVPGTGTQFAGGAGANSGEGGGGGGGGWFGGGGGRCQSPGGVNQNGAGGGGSGYAVSSALVSSASTTSGYSSGASSVGGLAGGFTNSQYVNGIGQGGGNGDGCGGMVVLQYSIGQPKLAVTKTVSQTPLVVGQSGQTYSIKINVSGAATTAPISLTDVLPAGLTTSGAISATGGTLSNCPAVGATSLAGCTIATGAAVGDIVITVPVSVAASTVSPAVNTATVTGGGDVSCPGAATCTSSVSTPILDALDETASKQPNIATTTDISTNDRYPASSTYATTGGTCSGITMSSAGVASYTSPAANTSCTVLY